MGRGILAPTDGGAHRCQSARWRPAAGRVRGSLDAARSPCMRTPQLLEQLRELGGRAAFVLITSGGWRRWNGAGGRRSSPNWQGLRLQVVASGDDKCERCWHRRPEVGQFEAHPTLCSRCVENVFGDGNCVVMRSGWNSLQMVRSRLLVIALDQYTKLLAEGSLDYGRPVEVFPGSTHPAIQYRRGLQFSQRRGGWQRYFSVAVALAISLALVVWLHKMPR